MTRVDLEQAHAPVLGVGGVGRPMPGLRDGREDQETRQLRPRLSEPRNVRSLLRPPPQKKKKPLLNL